MDGTAIENCVYDFWDAGCGCNRPHPERTYLDQLRYLAFANQHWKQTECIVQHGGVEPAHRSYGLATYLLTKEGASVLGELNHARDYWAGPPGGTQARHRPRGAPRPLLLPRPGEWSGAAARRRPGLPRPRNALRARLQARKGPDQPTSTGHTVPLGDTYVCDGTSRRSVTLSPQSGIVCSR